MNILEKQVLSCDGVHQLKGVIYQPEGEVKGLFQIVHGMTEYLGRYASFMELLCNNGYLVFGYDHLGHGKTANEDEYGFIAKKDGWKLLVHDVANFANTVRAEYGKDKPYYLMGHSMGSFIVRLAASEAKPDKLIVMGTAGPNPLLCPGLIMVRIAKLFKGAKGYSNFIDNLAFGTYNDHFKNDEEADEKCWLTANIPVRKAYLADNLCMFKFTLSAMQDLMKLNGNCNGKMFYDALDKTLPILLVSGDDDPVGNYGKGVEQVYQKLQAKGFEHVQMHLYKGGRHEILNESCREQLIGDILAFIQ